MQKAFSARIEDIMGLEIRRGEMPGLLSSRQSSSILYLYGGFMVALDVRAGTERKFGYLGSTKL